MLALAAWPARAASDESGLRVWDGTVACLGASGCDDAEALPRFAFDVAATGERLPFAERDERARLFADPRVRALLLRVVGRERAGSIEIQHVYAVEDGHLHDVYFRCDVCNITAHAPGPCWCCREPLELRHPPARDPHPLARGGPP